jgi:RNA polymerase sigma factor for flagellar operon FliA
MNRLPPSVQADDLIQAGMIGLLEASRNYDPTQGASFETYAGIRIRGAMLDEIRRSDWTPRSVHRKARLVAEAMREIENREGRDARDAEVAEALDMELEEYHQILQDASGCRIFSLDELASVGELGFDNGRGLKTGCRRKTKTRCVSIETAIPMFRLARIRNTEQKI